MLEHLSSLQLFWMAMIAPLSGVITVTIREYASYRRLKLALRKAKPSERVKILEAMTRLEARWPWRRNRTSEPPHQSPPARAHDPSSA